MIFRISRPLFAMVLALGMLATFAAPGPGGAVDRRSYKDGRGRGAADDDARSDGSDIGPLSGDASGSRAGFGGSGSGPGEAAQDHRSQGRAATPRHRAALRLSVSLSGLRQESGMKTPLPTQRRFCVQRVRASRSLV